MAAWDTLPLSYEEGCVSLVNACCHSHCTCLLAEAPAVALNLGLWCAKQPEREVLILANSWALSREAVMLLKCKELPTSPSSP